MLCVVICTPVRAMPSFTGAVFVSCAATAPCVVRSSASTFTVFAPASCGTTTAETRSPLELGIFTTMPASVRSTVDPGMSRMTSPSFSPAERPAGSTMTASRAF
jgi:hypothetical protein